MLDDAALVPARNVMNNSDCLSGVTQNVDSNVKSNSIGLLFALGSSVLIGSSYVINKISTERINSQKFENADLSQEECQDAESTYMVKPRRATLEKIKLNKLNQEAQETQEKLGYKFLKSPLWWCYILFTAGGEGCNAAAYNFAPATLVTPLGALSMVVTCILSCQFLRESLNIVSRIGVALAILGSVFIILNAPVDQKIESLDALKSEHLYTWPFMLYSGVNLVGIFLSVWNQKKHFFYRILVISLCGSFVVISLKSITIVATQEGFPGMLTNYATYAFIAVLVTGLVVNAMQLTKALSLADASTVIPIHYVCFTSSVIVGTNILFQEYKNMNVVQMIQVSCGFVILCIAVFLIQEFKGVNMQIVRDSKLPKNSSLLDSE